jgi:hypothetical protein
MGVSDQKRKTPPKISVVASTTLDTLTLLSLAPSHYFTKCDHLAIYKKKGPETVTQSDIKYISVKYLFAFD